MGNIVVGDLLTLKGEKYITMDVVQYDGSIYSFVNKVTEAEEPTEEFHTLELVSGGVKFIKDTDLINKLLPIFTEHIKDIAEKGIIE